MDLPKLYTALRNARADVIEARYAEHNAEGVEAGERYQKLMDREHRLDRLCAIVKSAHKAKQRRIALAR